MHTVRGSTEPIAPTGQVAQIARDSIEPLAALLHDDQQGASVRVQVRTKGDSAADVELPRAVMVLVLRALQEMAKGNGVALLAVDAELTTQQAADILGVSRPFLIKLLDEGRLPYRRVGAHRRILAFDVRRYAAEERARRERVMEKLVAETHRLGL